MKKKVLLALLLGLCMAVSGCSAKDKETSAETTEAVSETENSSETAESQADSKQEKESDETETEKRDPEPDYKALDYVTLGEYKGLEVTVSPMEVTEEDFQKQYFVDCQSNDKLEQVKEGTVADGDVVNIDYVGSVDGVEFDGGTDKGADLTIGSGMFIPGFEDGLIGAKIGSETDVNVTFPDPYQNADLAGKDAVFKVTVNYVKKAPELTDELAAAISEEESAADYKKAVEEQLAASKQSQRDAEVINGILNMVYSDAKINDYPAEVVNYRASDLRSYYEDIAKQQEQDFATFLKEQMEMTEEQFDEQCKALIKQSMLQELLLKAVAESENLELTEEEFEENLGEYVTNTGSESKETLLAKYPEEEIRRNMILDKALDFLKENAVVKEETAEETESVSETAAEETEEGAKDTEVSQETETAKES